MKSKTHLIKPKPVFINITPFGFYHYGKEFFDTAIGFEQSIKYSPVPYYLYCHSIELFLKAFLLVKGITIEKLKNKYGHNLKKIFKKAIELDLGDYVQITPEQKKELLKANEYYNIPLKGFEYFDVSMMAIAFPDLPALSVLKEVASELENNLKPVSLGAT